MTANSPRSRTPKPTSRPRRQVHKKTPARTDGKKPAYRGRSSYKKKPTKGRAAKVTRYTNTKKPSPRNDQLTGIDKVQKIIAASGLVSRRGAEAMIAAGRVTLNGKVVAIGARVADASLLRIDGKPLPKASTSGQLIMYNKKRGEIVSRAGHDTVFANLPRLQGGRWLNVGRLDVDTEGLLLFTTSGELANQLAHPRCGLEREYLVRTKELIAPAVIAEICQQGLTIQGETITPVALRQRNSHGNLNHWYEIVLTHGRNRVVRRLFAALDAEVNRLIRIRFGNYIMPRELTAGQWLQLPLKQ